MLPGSSLYFRDVSISLLSLIFCINLFYRTDLRTTMGIKIGIEIEINLGIVIGIAAYF